MRAVHISCGPLLAMSRPLPSSPACRLVVSPVSFPPLHSAHARVLENAGARSVLMQARGRRLRPQIAAFIRAGAFAEPRRASAAMASSPADPAAANPAAAAAPPAGAPRSGTAAAAAAWSAAAGRPRRERVAPRRGDSTPRREVRRMLRGLLANVMLSHCQACARVVGKCGTQMLKLVQDVLVACRGVDLGICSRPRDGVWQQDTAF